MLLMDGASDADIDVEAEAEAAPAAKPRPSLLSYIAMLLVAPVLTGAGVFGGMLYMSPQNPAPVAEPIPTEVETVASIDPTVAAEISFVYSYSLSELLKERCGEVVTASLKAASDFEKRNDFTLASRSQAAAEKRAHTISSDKSCNRILLEIEAEEKRARRAGY